MLQIIKKNKNKIVKLIFFTMNIIQHLEKNDIMGYRNK